MTKITDKTVVPIQVPDIGGKSFLFAFQTKKEFVDFIVHEADCCTGFFLDFQRYCKKKLKEDE